MHGLLYEVVETVEHGTDVLRVRGVVERRVEIDADVRIAANELAEILVFFPRAHRVALHEPIGLVPLESRLDEREQQALREVEAMARFEVAPHALRKDDQAFDEPSEAVDHVVEREE